MGTPISVHVRGPERGSAAEHDGTAQDGTAGSAPRAGPVKPLADSRMAPKPMRLIGRSPRSRKVWESGLIVSP
ncbi:hypothetical protein [Phytohabitans aurantiacus]|uniref:Uncharacterized protein n=1 Tax=Phytohabitans aurantiacus TaxID=3016789 RepID=A0ABQ5QY28_9ACTN|nr:hypothetical protein [Phytohabitans aurantiacus]GLH98836.1 hypothetical protein Pa4123_41110 [Phytohabitans aurantiacus]